MDSQAENPKLIDLRPKTVPWVDFEEEVAAFAEKQVGDGSWGISSHSTKVRRKPEYFSKAREANITFDVSIEIFLKDDFSKPLCLWIIECKDYPSRKVKVDELEEFHHKLQQVGAHKGMVCTRVGFERGAIEIAKSHGITLITLQKEESWVIQLSRTGGSFKIEQFVVPFWVRDDGKETHQTHFDYVLGHGLKPFDIMVMPILP